MTGLRDEIVVVGSARAVETWELRGARAETLATFERRLASKLLERAIASPDASRLAVRAALLARGVVRSDRDGAARTGTVDAFDRALGKLFAAGVTPAVLERAGRGTGADAERARLLAALAGDVEERLARAGLVDRRAVARDLARAVERATPADVVRAARSHRIVARGIFAWNGGDATLWRALDGALSRAGGGARVELPMFSKAIDPERDRDPLEVLIDDLAHRLDAAPDAQPIAARLGDLRFADDDAVVEHVSLHHAANATAQARAVATLVRRAIDAGSPVDAIAIAAPGMDEHVVREILAALAAAGIPAVARASSSHRAPIVRAAASALAMLEGEPSRVELRSLAEGPFLRADDDTFVRARTKRPKNGSIRARIDWARARLAELSVDLHPTRGVLDTFASDSPRSAVASLELDAHGGNARAWRSLGNAFDAVEAAAVRLGLSSDDVDGEELARLVELSADDAAGTPLARAGAVLVGGLPELAGDLDLLIVVDANEGSLPSARRPDAIVTDGVLARLRELDPAHVPLPQTIAVAAEWASLAYAAASARDVAFVHRSQGGEGEPVGPSPVAAWLERRGVAPTNWLGGPLASHPLGARAARLQRLAFDPAARAEIAPEETRRATTELARERFHSKKIESDIVGDLSGAAAADRLQTGLASAERPLSITALEDFARCAFRGYAKAVLGLREAEQEPEAPDARERGKLLHEALRAAFAATLREWAERPRPIDSLREKCLAAAERSLPKTLDAVSSTRTALAAIVRRQVMEEVARIVDFSLADSTFDPVFVEQSFGRRSDRSSWPGLVIERGEKTAVLQGQIDRVDVAHERRATVRVVDYKSSLATSKDAHRDLGKGTLQVPLYARAAMVSMEADRAEGMYLPSRDIGAAMANRPKFEARWQELGANEVKDSELTARVFEVLDAPRRAHVFPVPSQERDCDRCPFDGVCRRPRFVVSEEEDEDTVS